tara:strand:+ start:247 stop:444 length:198 start_codon:yes stop_codon:yes gene_type:complete
LDTNNFGSRRVFSFDLGNSEIPFTNKQKRETILLMTIEAERGWALDQKSWQDRLAFVFKYPVLKS